MARNRPASANPVASQRVADQIRERILAGTLAPGTRITQDELAAELNASRIPVREALWILESAGLVVRKSNLGTWVASMDVHDCEIAYQIRERLEPLLLAESYPALTATDVGRLDEIQHDIEATDDIERFLVLDRMFHWAMYRGHDAAELESIIARLWDTTQQYRRAFTRLAGNERRWVINSEHRLLIDGMATGDIESAQRVLAQHIARTRTELVAHPELFTDSAPHSTHSAS